jgi:anti-sigma B factor antagonist
MRISDHEVDSETHVLEVEGEVDLYTAPELKARMAEVFEAGKIRLVMDFSEVTYIDSTTLGVLVGGVKRVRPAGGSLALVCTDEKVIELFTVTGLDRAFPLHATRQAALQAVGEGT